MVKCSIEQVVSVLISSMVFRPCKKFYIVDVSGISEVKGNQDITISILEDGNISSRAVIKTTMKVVTLEKGSPYIGFQKRFLFTAKPGQKLQMEVAFIWDSRKFKKTDNDSAILSLQIDNLQLLSEKPVLIKKWNKGYRITNLFLVRPGHTINLTLDFSSKKTGVYQGEQTNCNVMIFNMSDENSGMRVLKGNPVVRVSKTAGQIVLTIEGALKDDKEVVRIRGQLQQ